MDYHGWRCGKGFSIHNKEEWIIGNKLIRVEAFFPPPDYESTHSFTFLHIRVRHTLEGDDCYPMFSHKRVYGLIAARVGLGVILLNFQPEQPHDMGSGGLLD